jgi:CSLREA domain-containing protein
VFDRIRRRGLLLTVLGTLLIGLVGVSPVRAIGLGWTVDSTGDSGDQNTGNILCRTIVNTCTLRAAIQQANAIDPGPGNHHTITLPAGTITMFLESSGEDNAVTGDYDLKRSVTIRGQGPSETIIQGSTTNAEDAFDRIFDIQTLGIDFVLQDLTVRRGNAHLVSGGGIRVNNFGANITLDNVTMTGNRSFDGHGAAISARGGLLTILDSRITNNHAPDGAVVAVDGGTLTVRRSTFANNFVWNGAIEVHGDGSGLIERSTFTDQTTNGVTQSALRVGRNSTDQSEVVVRNSTFAGNDGMAGSTVIFGNRDVDLDIESSTIAGNNGFGLSGSAGTTIRNTLLAGNDEGNCNDIPTSLGHNLDTGSTCNLDGDGDISGGTADLATLASNGGPTRTRALGAESDAIDAGLGCPGIDQRGATRPKDGDGNGNARCDIGAYEAPKNLALVTPEPTVAATEPPPTAAPTAAPTVEPSAAPTEAPPSAGPSSEPGASAGSPTAGAGSPVPTAGSPGETPAATPAPVPAVGADSGGQVLVIGLAALLFALLLGFFLALRRRKPKPAA